METRKMQASATEVRGNLTNMERDILHDVGFDVESKRSATSILTDHEIRLALSNDPGVEIMPLAVALRTYDFVQDLMFGLVAPDENDHISLVAEHMHEPLGHFTWVKPGAKVKLPVQAFTLLETPQARQFTHDVTLIDEDADVEMVTGAAVPSSVHKARHISIGETYLRANAALKSISVENWGEAMEVHSYGYCSLAAGARSTSTSIKMSPIRHHTSRSVTMLDDDASSVDQSIIFAPEGTERVMETETRLNGSGAKSEDLARMVSAGGRILNNALLIGDAPGTTGFLGCDGLKLTDHGEILAVPSLLARAEGAQLSHEASVGMIDGDKLNYLMASGMDEDAARDLIVQGFLTLEDENIPETLRRQVSEMVSRAKSGGM